MGTKKKPTVDAGTTTTADDGDEADVELVFNPDFTFDDLGDDDDVGVGRRNTKMKTSSRSGGGGGGAQSAWDFSDARREAKRELRAKAMTSVDEKIARVKNAGKAKAGSRSARKKGGVEDDDDDYGSDSEDAPLPGEDLDDDDDDESVSGSDSESESDEESDSEEESGSEESASGESGDESGSGGSSGSEDEEEEDEEEDDDDEEQTEKKKKKTAVGKEASPPPESDSDSESDGGFQERAVVSGVKGDTTFDAKAFEELHLSRALTKACEVLGYKKPTPIQAAVIPIAMTGREDRKSVV